MSAPDVQAPPRADLAVVIVNYNAGEYLARCVTSVVEAAGELTLDLLIVDNASHDGSARVAAERTPHVRLIENPTNRGLSPAWNQGARAVDAPWILFLNPDAEHGDLGAFVKTGEQHPDVALVGPVIRNPDGRSTKAGAPSPASCRPSPTRSSGRSRPTTASHASTSHQRCLPPSTSSQHIALRLALAVPTVDSNDGVVADGRAAVPRPEAPVRNVPKSVMWCCTEMLPAVLQCRSGGCSKLSDERDHFVGAVLGCASCRVQHH